MPSPADNASLKRSVGLATLTFYGLGNILGAGIYVLIGAMAGHAGMATPLAFIVAAVVAAFSVLTYSELAARFPLSAGEAVYVQEGLHITALSRLVGLLVATAGMVSAATVTRGFYGYLTVFVDLPATPVIILLVAAIGLLAMWGISQSTATAAFLTLVEMGGLLLVIWAGSDTLATLPQRLPELVPELRLEAWQALLPAAFLAFFAFIGFEDMVNIAEEVKNPSRNMPLAILAALLIASVFYLVVSLVAVLAVPPAELAASEAPLAMVYERSTGATATVLSLVGMLAVINGALIQMIMASRIFYGMARQRLLWAPLAAVHPRTRTPVAATALVIGIVLALALWLPLQQLAAGTSFLILAVFALVNASLIAIKLREEVPPGRPCYPLWIPAAGLLSSIGLALAQLLG
jgi:amino acid transporter